MVSRYYIKRKIIFVGRVNLSGHHTGHPLRETGYMIFGNQRVGETPRGLPISDKSKKIIFVGRVNLLGRHTGRPLRETEYMILEINA